MKRAYSIVEEVLVEEERKGRSLLLSELTIQGRKKVGIAKDAPLAVVVPELGASSKSRRKARVTEERDGEMEGGERRRHEEKLRLDRFMAKLEFSKVGVILYAVGYGYTFRSKPQEGFMAFRGQIRLGMQLSLPRMVKEPKVTQHKRRRVLGEDVDKELTEAKLEEHARVTAASMAMLCGTNPDKVGRRMNKTMHQMLGCKLLSRRKSESRGLSEMNARGDSKLSVTIIHRLKTFIEALGYDLKTLKCFSTTNDPIVEDGVQTEGLEIDVAGVAAGGGVKEAAAGTGTDKVTDVVVLKSSTKGTGSIRAKELIGGDYVATSI
ncbi:hypothetical protein GIB67_012040 [Kingdonia uniflora]|uniref:Uncharacterized protein n=1 Tax=Kingdonia uniflora TaxID=39325 RepID=A0A7J7M074_9MAGN|nr:hypothetical protein GIB67_012040 [Kingdonia uniflora]